MNARIILRHLVGYAVGCLVFILTVPYGLYRLSAVVDPRLGLETISNLTVRAIIAAPIFLLGSWFALWSNLSLFTVGKGGPADGFNVAISPRTKRLVTEGPYRHTRNPMVFGMFSVYVAEAILLGSVACLAALGAFLGLVIIYLKLTEERRLARDFGDEFAQYRKRVPMIFPWPRNPKQPNSISY